MPASPILTSVDISQIRPAPSNPRRQRDQQLDDELLESVLKVGILQPVLLRRQPDLAPNKPPAYELVAGSRRLQAARAAGLTELPATIHELTDLEVLEIQIVENAQRADVHPIDEADAYHALHTTHSLAVEDIALKVGKSRAHVYGRLKLVELCAAGRKALLAGHITPSVALLVARIPNAKLQLEAVRHLTSGVQFHGPLNTASARRQIRVEFMLELKHAPFKPGDASLVPGAGSCSACPKRTGNDRDLFGDVQEADVCTDPVCFGRKADAAWSVQRQAARAAGDTVLEGNAAKSVYSHGNLKDRSLVKLSDRCYSDAKSRTWGALLGKEAPAKVLVRDESDKSVHVFVNEARAKKILAAAGKVFSKEKPSRRAPSAQEAKDDRASRALQLASEEALGRIVASSDELLTDEIDGWRWLATALCRKLSWSDLKAIVARRDLAAHEVKKGRGARRVRDVSELVADWVAAQTHESAVRALVVELLVLHVHDFTASYRANTHDNMFSACAALNIDFKELRLKHTRALAKEAKAKRAPKVKPKAT